MAFKKLCSNIDCGRASFAKGFCAKCYAKHRRIENKDAIRERYLAKSRTVVGRYNQSKSAASRRGLRWDISLEEFKELISKPCFYCGDTLSGTGSALDRINNSLGYIPRNVLPCCGRCNTTRNSHWTVEEAAAMIKLGLKMRKAA